VFDARYHALSLAAVLVALVLGLLLGVAIGDAGLVSSAERKIRADLRSDVSAANARARELQGSLEQKDRFANEVYPLLVTGQLEGSRVGLVFLGETSDAIVREVRQALADTGGRLSTVATLREPVDLSGLAEAAPGTRYAALDDDPDLVEPFGERMGFQLVRGGRLLRRVDRALFSTQAGGLHRLDAVVVYRGGPSLEGRQDARRDELEDGFVRGLREAGARVAGVETRTTDPSQIPWYDDRGLSTVDNVDDVAGHAALVFVLAGAEGDYGVKDTADALLPKVAGGAPTP
jgi:Copper transport outer membrane protein, MctB